MPLAASRVLGDHVGTDDYTPIASGGGHIGIYVSGRAQRECRRRSTTGWPSVRADLFGRGGPAAARPLRPSTVCETVS